MKELIMIQQGLKATKDKYNNFGKYPYRSCESILESVKPLLLEQGCFLVISDDIELIGDRFYVRAIATLTNSEGKSVSATALAREQESKAGMDASQLTGSTSSYARKYALCGLLCIDDNKDADDMDNTGEGHHSPAPKQKEEDKREWMTEKQFESCIARISSGVLDTYDKAVATWRMKKEYRERLHEATEYYKSTHS